MEVLVQTNHLTKQYGKHKIINDVNISVMQGDIYGLIGRNGAGKTTLLGLISGLARPTGGDVYLWGDNGQNAVSVRKKIGVLIEAPGVYPSMSAADNIKLKCLATGISGKDRIAELLDIVGLSDASRKKVKHFSVGMKQRLGIALALVGSPELVILDEPVNGLDPQGMTEVRQLIMRLNRERNTTFIISSHILGELSKIATHYGILDNGELKKQIRKAKLTEDLEKYFLNITGGRAHA